MNKTDLMNKLSKLIEREVKKQVKEQLSNMLLEFELVPKIKRKRINDSKIVEPYDTPSYNTTEDPIWEPEVKQRNSDVTYSSNPTLNKLLSETANNRSNTPTAVDPEKFRNTYRNLMDKEVFDSSDIDTIRHGRMSPHARPNLAATTTGLSGERLNTSTPEGQEVQKALTRDYSELVKRFKKK